MARTVLIARHLDCDVKAHETARKPGAARVARAHSEAIDPTPELETAQELVGLEDTIITDGRPNMSIDFELRVDLDEHSKRALKEDLSSLLGHYQRLADNPKKIIVSRPSADPHEDRIVAVIKGESGEYLGSIVAEANGTGMLTFNPSGR